MLLEYGIAVRTFTDSSPPDYKAFRSSEHKPHHHVKVSDRGGAHLSLVSD